MAKRSRARAAAKSKAMADILADIELIEQALQDSEELAEQGGGTVASSSGMGHGKPSAMSALDKAAQASGGHAQSQGGITAQSVASLLNTHNPHGWVRNALHGNISGGTFSNLGYAISAAGGGTLGADLMGLGAKFAPHIFLIRYGSQYIKEKMAAAVQQQIQTTEIIGGMQRAESSYASGNKFSMGAGGLTAMRQMGAARDTALAKAGGADDNLFKVMWNQIIDPGRLTRAESAANIQQNNYIYQREHPYISQNKREEMKLSNLIHNEQVLRQFELRTGFGPPLPNDPLGLGSAVRAGVAFLTNPEYRRNVWLRGWQSIGDPFKIWQSAVTKAAEDYNKAIQRDAIAHARNIKDFWENPTTGPVHRAQEMERTRWQAAVEEDHIVRFLQWNSA